MNKLTTILDTIFSENTTKNKAVKYTNSIIVFLILASTIEIVLSSDVNFSKYYFYLEVTYYVTSSFFLFEYLIRLGLTFSLSSKNKGLSGKLKFIFEFYNLIDLVSILPFLAGFFGIQFYAFLKALRVFRILKIMRYLPSVNLLQVSIKNKRSELIISLQTIFILALLLSIGLYYAESNNLESQFTSITQALLWSIAKFVGDIGGYGDFTPVTATGKILATLNGVLGIAIFALPAGIIGSGFVEEIEKRNEDKTTSDNLDLIKSVFDNDHLAATLRFKKKYDLIDVKRKFISVNDLKYRLNLTDESISAVIDKNQGLRIRTYNSILPDGTKIENVIAECFEENTSYGTFINRKGIFNIVTCTSIDQPFMSHFCHTLASYTGANLISVEKYSRNNFDPRKNVDFTDNPNLFQQDNLPDCLVDFTKDIQIASLCSRLTLFILPKASKGFTFELLNGGKIGKDLLEIENSLFDQVTILEKFFNDFKNSISEHQQTIGMHHDYGYTTDFHITQYIKKEVKQDVFQIAISAELLKDNGEAYYRTINLLGKSLIKMIEDGK